MRIPAGQLDGQSLQAETLSLTDEVWGRLHARLEQWLTKLEATISARFDRSLEPTEVLAAIEWCDVIASEIGVLGFPGAADLMRRVAETLSAPTLDLSHAIAMASLLDDARNAIATTVADLRLLNHNGLHLKVVGAVSSRVDELIWLASSLGLQVTHDADGLTEDRQEADAVVMVVEDPDLTRSRPLIRSVREVHAHQPIVLVAPIDGSPHDAVSERARVADAVTTILDHSLHPLEIINEVRQAVIRAAFPMAIGVVGAGAEWLAENLAPSGIDATVEPSVDAAFDSLRTGRTRGVLITPETEGLPPLVVLRAIRADRQLRSAVVVMIENRADAARQHTLRREGVDDIVPNDVDLDDLAVLIKSRLARRAVLEPVEQGDNLKGAAPWDTAVVLMERMLTMSFRRHAPVGLGLIRFDVSEDELASGEVEQAMAREFRQEDVIARVDDRHVVVALQGVDRGVILRRISDLHTKFSLHERAGRAACVQFPVDGRSLDELLENAEETLAAAGVNGTPNVLGFDWEPPDARAADVLLVDPDRTLGSVLTAALERRGLSVEQEADSLDALSHLTGVTGAPLPKVVLLELDLLGIDGLQFLRQVREAGTLNSCRFIILSSRTNEADLRQAFELGADDFVSKPFSTPLLLHRLNRALAK